MSLRVLYGTMKSGKTTNLVNEAYLSVKMGMATVFCCPALDTREEGPFSSHNDFLVRKVACPAVKIKTVKEIPLEYETICIDEGQFLPGIYAWCLAERRKGKNIIVAGLISDFRGKPFQEMMELVHSADSATNLPALCEECMKERKYKPAIFNQRVSGGDSVILIGKDEYRPVCFDCFFKENPLDVLASVALEHRIDIP